MMNNTKQNLTMDPLADSGIIAEYSPGVYKKEAVAFLKQCLDEDVFEKLCRNENFRRNPVIGAKLFLGASDWNKYVWIEQHGSLEGFS